MDALQERVLRWIVRLTDLLAIALSMLIALAVHGALLGVIPGLREPSSLSYFIIFAFLCVGIWQTAQALLGSDRLLSDLPSAAKIALDLVRLHAIAIGGTLSLLWFSQLHLNRGVLIVFGAVNGLVTLGLRLIVVRLAKARLKGGGGCRWLIMLGDDEALQHAAQAFSAPALHLHQISCADGTSAKERLRRSLHELPVDRVILLPPFDGFRQAQPLLELCEDQGIPAMIPHIVTTKDARSVEQVSYFGVTGLSLSRRLKPSLALAVKQLADTLGTALGLVLVSPILLVVAALIAIQDGRPIFFSQERVGYNGRRFRMHKFRTMVKDAEARKAALLSKNEAGGPVFKLTNDPRITPLGAFLRRSSIDELPQLFNVLTGDMSLIGPRPLPVAEQQQIHGASRRRLAMKPGITGLWQVSGRSDITFEEWMKLDLQYVDEWSLGLDLRILAKTVPTVLFWKGAR